MMPRYADDIQPDEFCSACARKHPEDDSPCMVCGYGEKEEEDTDDDS